MKKITFILTAVLFTGFLSAQSLYPVTFAPAGKIPVKAGYSMTQSVGELKLKAVDAPAKSEIVYETASMEIYPNPANSSVSFNFHMEGQSKIKVSLINGFGQKLADVFSGSYDNGKLTETMDLSGYTPGMYFISVRYTDANGKLRLISKKFQVI